MAVDVPGIQRMLATSLYTYTALTYNCSGD